MARGLKYVAIVVLVVAALTGAFIYSGLYNVGADAPHAGLVSATFEELRDHSIARQAQGIAVPRDLNEPKRVAMGAGLYNEMCCGCHLGPGVERSELSQGLYPAAPELARGNDLS